MRLARVPVVLFLASLAAACGGTAPPGAAPGGAPPPHEQAGLWRVLPDGPLGPRQNVLGFWTGSEVVLVGGNDAPPCPPTADCTAPETPPLRDGAAFDPSTETWRSIAPSPVPLEWAQAVVVGDVAYVWAPGNPARPGAARAFLAYHVAEDRWETLPVPAEDREVGYAIVAAGERIVAYPGSDEVRELPDLVFDTDAATWTELPPDPLSPSFDRAMAFAAGELLLFDHELVPNPGSERPALTRAAALDLESGRWRHLPDSEQLASGPWFAISELLVNPMLGGADGGETNGWGREYPYGGTLDPVAGTWTALPDPPGGGALGGGLITRDGGLYLGTAGWVLDWERRSWMQLPAREHDLVSGETVIAAGRDLFVFGGARFDDTAEGTLVADASLWAPPAA